MRPVYAIPLANMVRVGWYLSPLGIGLGVIGFAVWWRRGMTRESWLFLVMALLVSAFYIRQTYGASDQHYIYILRRYMVLVYPAFALAGSYALVHLAAAGRFARLRRAAAATLGSLLVLFLIATNIPIYRHIEYAGALAQFEQLATRFEPEDVLLFRSGGRDTPDLLTTPLTYAYGLNALAIKSPRPDQYAPQLARYVERWQAEGRNVFVVLGPSGGIGLPGQQLVPINTLAVSLREFEQLTHQKPRNVYDTTLEFVVYLAQPTPGSDTEATAAIDAYVSQLRGLYRPEAITGMRLAWTDGDALIRVPWPAGDHEALEIMLAGGVRPASLGAAQACIEYRHEQSYLLDDPAAPFVAAGCVALDETPRPYRIAIGAPTAPGTGTLLVRIASEIWVPAEADPAQIDRRRLGVLYGGIAGVP